MKVKHTVDIEEYFQELVDSGEPLPTAIELGMTKKEYELLRSKYDLSDLGDEYGEFFV
jgi:hypothetical protein